METLIIQQQRQLKQYRCSKYTVHRSQQQQRQLKQYRCSTLYIDHIAEIAKAIQVQFTVNRSYNSRDSQSNTGAVHCTQIIQQQRQLSNTGTVHCTQIIPQQRQLKQYRYSTLYIDHTIAEIAKATQVQYTVHRSYNSRDS